MRNQYPSTMAPDTLSSGRPATLPCRDDVDTRRPCEIRRTDQAFGPRTSTRERHLHDTFDLSLSQAARLVPGRPHASSLWRWCRKGIGARNGDRIHLEHRRFGNRLFTSAAALERFSQRLAEADLEHFDNPDPSVRPRSPVRKPTPPTQDHARRVDLAEQRLRDLGF